MAGWFGRLKNWLGGNDVSSPASDSKTSTVPSRAKDLAKQSSVKKPSRLIRVVIGLDFGTSSTKVVFQKISEDGAWVSPSPVAAPGFSWFCTPTNVAFQPDKVVLGGVSEEGDPDHIPLKLKLFDLTGPLEEMTDTEQQVVGYLGWILESTIGAVRKQYGVRDFQPILNIGTPVAYFGSKEIIREQFRRYEGVARAALATTKLLGGPGIENNMDPGLFRSIVRDAWQNREKVDLVGVRPESISALVSLKEDPAVDGGIHCVVDIGAGTTEVSTSFLSYGSLACYEDSTIRLGIAHYPDGAAMEDPGECKQVLHRWWRQFEINWEQSRRKDAQNPVTHEAWRNTSIMFTGGGGFHPDVQPYFESQIKTDSPAHIHFGKGGWSMPIKPYCPSTQALKPSRGNSSDSRDFFHLLAVAHGLSFHRKRWPSWYRPEEVEAVDGPALEALPFDPVEAGYHGR